MEVRKRPISATSPATPLISTQSPIRMPCLPINTNQPKNAMMKSCRTSVSPAVVRPRMVDISLGAPKITNKMISTPRKFRQSVASCPGEGQEQDEHGEQGRDEQEPRPAKHAVNESLGSFPAGGAI